MKQSTQSFAAASLPTAEDEIAADGSEIRLLLVTEGASLAHGTLAVGQVSRAITHRSVAEIWYVVGGRAELWRQLGDDESTVTVAQGDALTIPVGTRFQYRTVGDTPFTFVMSTMPPWPGPDEAVPVPGRWGGAEQRSESPGPIRSREAGSTRSVDASQG